MKVIEKEIPEEIAAVADEEGFGRLGEIGEAGAQEEAGEEKEADAEAPEEGQVDGTGPVQGTHEGAEEEPEAEEAGQVADGELSDDNAVESSGTAPEEAEEVQVTEPVEHLAKSRPFAKKFQELEEYCHQLGEQLLVAMDLLEQRQDTNEERLNKHITELAGIRKAVNDSDAVQLRAKFKQINDQYVRHLQELH